MAERPLSICIILYNLAGFGWGLRAVLIYNPAKVTLKSDLMKSILPAVCFCLVLPGSYAAQANDAVTATQFRLLVGLGYGRYESLLAQDPDRGLYMLPRWQLYYKKFYVENLDLGLNLVSHQGWSFDLTTKQSFDAMLLRRHGEHSSLPAGLQVGEGQTPGLFDGLDPAAADAGGRHYSYLGGFTVLYQHAGWQLQSALHQDLSRVHQGREWASEISYAAIAQSVAVQTSLGIRKLDSAYSNYYFSHQLNGAVPDALPVMPGAQTLSSFKLAASWAVSAKTSLVLNWKREYLPRELRRSGLLDKREHDIWFTGVLFQY